MPVEHRPRRTARLPVLEIWGVPVRTFWFDVQGEEDPPPDVWAFARRTVTETLPGAMVEEGGA